MASSLVWALPGPAVRRAPERYDLRRVAEAGQRARAHRARRSRSGGGLSGRTAGAFDVIVERHRRSVYQLCYRFVGNHEDASDLSQDVFLRAYRGLGKFRGGSSLSTWLYRIGVNLCLNRVSRKTSRDRSD